MSWAGVRIHPLVAVPEVGVPVWRRCAACAVRWMGLTDSPCWICGGPAADTTGPTSINGATVTFPLEEDISDLESLAREFLQTAR